MLTNIVPQCTTSKQSMANVPLDGVSVVQIHETQTHTAMSSFKMLIKCVNWEEWVILKPERHSCSSLWWVLPVCDATAWCSNAPMEGVCEAHRHLVTARIIHIECALVQFAWNSDCLLRSISGAWCDNRRWMSGAYHWSWLWVTLAADVIVEDTVVALNTHRVHVLLKVNQT